MGKVPTLTQKKEVQKLLIRKTEDQGRLGTLIKLLPIQKLVVNEFATCLWPGRP